VTHIFAQNVFLIHTGFSASNGGHFPRIPPPFCRFLSESLTHNFAKFALVTLPIGLQDWNHRFAVN
jgi:hypothetical protein